MASRAAPAAGTDPAMADTNDPTGRRVGVARELASENVRMIADPAPLGLACFALTTFLLSLFKAGLIPEAGEPSCWCRARLRRPRPGARRDVGVPQGQRVRRHRLHVVRRLLAAVLGLRHVLRRRRPRGRHGHELGWYLIAWGIFTVGMLIAALRTTAVLAALFTLLATTFFLLGFGDLAHSEGLVRSGGYLGLVTAVLAWYACLAGVSASTFGRAVLPNPPLYKM